MISEFIELEKEIDSCQNKQQLIVMINFFNAFKKNKKISEEQSDILKNKIILKYFLFLEK